MASAREASEASVSGGEALWGAISLMESSGVDGNSSNALRTEHPVTSHPPAACRVSGKRTKQGRLQFVSFDTETTCRHGGTTQLTEVGVGVAVPARQWRHTSLFSFFSFTLSLSLSLCVSLSLSVCIFSVSLPNPFLFVCPFSLHSHSLRILLLWSCVRLCVCVYVCPCVWLCGACLYEVCPGISRLRWGNCTDFPQICIKL